MTQWLLKKEVCACEKEKASAPASLKLNLPEAKDSTIQFGRKQLIILAVTLLMLGVGAVVVKIVKDTHDAIAVLDSKPVHEQRIFYAENRDKKPNSSKFTMFAFQTIKDGNYHYVGLKDAVYEDAKVVMLHTMPKVTEISIENCGDISYLSLDLIVQKEELTYLSLAHSALNQKALDSWGTSHVEFLDLSHTGIDRLDWDFLRRMRTLDTLYINGVEVNDSNQKLLASLGFTGSHGKYTRHQK